MRAPNKLLKVSILSTVVALTAVYSLLGQQVRAFVSGPPAASTGAPGELSCVSCHNSFALNSGPGTLTIAGLPTSYSPNQEVTVTVALNQSNRPRYGFQLTALDETGKQAGTFILSDTNKTQLLSESVGGNPRSYVEHTFAGAGPTSSNQASWTFKWVAPSAEVGKVTFFAAGNAANGNGSSSGDYIYTKSVSIEPAAVTVPVTSVSAASFARGAPLAGDMIVAAFGTQLATGIAVATEDVDPNTPGIQLPTTLGGTTVKIKDSAGVERAAQLFFVSSTQVNYHVPPETAPGTATVTVTSGNGTVSTGTVQVERVAPGLFAANSNGQDVAAGYALRVKADNSQSFESIAVYDGVKMISRPLDLSPETDRVFLVLFGTGLRFLSSPATAEIGGVAARVDYAGMQGGFVGLDQVNLLLPRSLIGRGEAEIVLQVDGRVANTVKVNIR